MTRPFKRLATAPRVEREKRDPFAWGRTLKARRRELFWVWIAYQTIKGLTTTSLIWAPLILWWLKGG